MLDPTAAAAYSWIPDDAQDVQSLAEALVDPKGTE